MGNTDIVLDARKILTADEMMLIKGNADIFKRMTHKMLTDYIGITKINHEKAHFYRAIDHYNEERKSQIKHSYTWIMKMNNILHKHMKDRIEFLDNKLEQLRYNITLFHRVALAWHFYEDEIMSYLKTECDIMYYYCLDLSILLQFTQHQVINI